jgi:hypothetical protein
MNSRERKISKKLAQKMEGERKQKGFIELDTQRDLPIKRAMSAYVLFGNELRRRILKDESKVPVTEVVKLIAVEWKKLDK